MTTRVRIVAMATQQSRFLSIEAKGSDAGTVALFTAALSFISGQPDDRGPPIVAPPVPAISPPKKPRRRRP
jgi:hypothetical protein